MARVGASGVALVAVVVVVAVVAGVLLTRPGDPGPTPPSDAQRQAGALAGILGSPAGTTSVDVGAARDARGYPYVATVVTLDRSATGAQVADVVDSLPTATRRVGLPAAYRYRQLSFLTSDGARLTVAWEPEVDAAAVGAAADGWLAAADALGDRADVAAIVLTGGGISYRLTLGPTHERDVLADYDRAATTVASEPAEEQSRVQWDVSGTVGQSSLRLSSAGPLDSSREQEWTDLLADSHRVAGPLRISRFEVTFGDRVEAHLAVLAPDDVDDAHFTPAAYGGAVFAAVRPQLRTLARGTDHWSYFLSWAHRSEPGSEQLLALLFGDQGTVSDGTGKDRSPDASAGWAEAARAFVPGR